MIALLRCSVWVEIACCVKGPATTSTQVSLHQPSPKPPPSHRMFSRAAPLVPRCHCPSLLACAMRCDSVPVQLCAYTFSAQATNALAPSPGRPCNPTHAPSPEWSTPWSPPMLSLARTPKPSHAMPWCASHGCTQHADAPHADTRRKSLWLRRWYHHCLTVRPLPHRHHTTTASRSTSRR